MENIISHEPEIVTCHITSDTNILITSDGVCDTTKETYQDTALSLVQSVRDGADAESLMTQRLAHPDLDDNATILLWSTF